MGAQPPRSNAFIGAFKEFPGLFLTIPSVSYAQIHPYIHQILLGHLLCAIRTVGVGDKLWVGSKVPATGNWPLVWGQHKFSINISCFEGCVVSVAATKLCRSSHRHSLHTGVKPWPSTASSERPGNWPQLGFGSGHSVLIPAPVSEIRKDFLYSGSAKYIFLMSFQNISTLEGDFRASCPSFVTLSPCRRSQDSRVWGWKTPSVMGWVVLSPNPSVRVLTPALQNVIVFIDKAFKEVN